MTVPIGFRCVSWGASLCLAPLLVWAPPADAGGEPLPYALGVHVEYGDPHGPETLRREIELELLDELVRARCFDSVGPHERQADEPRDGLLLWVVLDDFEDRMIYDSSIAQRTSPNVVPQEEAQRVVASLAIRVRLELLLLPEEQSLRRSAFHLERSYRPTGFEDPRDEVAWRVTDRVARETRAFACKGSPAKLARAIERVRATSR